MKLSDITFKIAERRDELESSYSLVCRRYRQQGYLPEDWDSDLWVTAFCALPETITVVAKREEEVIATVSLFPDSSLGFPLQVVFEKEVLEKKESEKLDFWEIGMLAVSEKISPRENVFDSIAYLGVVMGLFKSIYDIGNYFWNCRKVEPAFFIAVVESHIKFYEMLGFIPLCSQLKPYSTFHEVYAMCLFQRLGRIVETAYNRPFLRKFFQIQTNVFIMNKKYKWSWEDVEYFFKVRTKLWNKLSEEKKMLLSSLYCYQSGS